MDQKEILSQRYHTIKSEIGPTQLLAVSKYTSLENVQTLYQLGHRQFGENRITELIERSRVLPKDIEWHFIGNIQSKKLKSLIGVTGLKAIHSIDRLSTLEKLLKLTPAQKIDVYLQFNISGEEAKSGFQSFEALNQAIEFFLSSENKENFQLAGIMGMAAIRTSNYADDARASFNHLVKIKEQVLAKHPQLNSFHLNMGMSKDYLIAVELGSHIIRVGSTLFG